MLNFLSYLAEHNRNSIICINMLKIKMAKITEYSSCCVRVSERNNFKL